MKNYHVYNGKKEIPIAIPDDREVTLVGGRPVEPLPDLEGAIREAVSNPIGSPRLAGMVKRGQKVAIIATDITRMFHEDIILDVLLEELTGCGIPYGDITLVVATGTHRPNSEEEFIAMYGSKVVSRVKVVNHDPWKKEGLVDLGKSKTGIPLVVNRLVAQADVRISTGVIEPHLFAGYSGGVKSVAVGVAGEETIGATHNYEMMKKTRLGLIENNPFRDFLTEATQAIGLDFIVNVVQNSRKELVRVVAGDPVAAFQEGVKAARDLVEVEIDEPGEIVIAGVTYPKSRDLYQATRAANSSVFGPRPAVKRGGVILIPTSCEDGFGHPGYVEWMKGCKTPEEIVSYAQERGFAPGDQKALILAWILQHARLVITDCAIPPEELAAIHLEAAPSLQGALERELIRYPAARIIVIPDGIFHLPMVRVGGPVKG